MRLLRLVQVLEVELMHMRCVTPLVTAAWIRRLRKSLMLWCGVTIRLGKACDLSCELA